MKKINKDIVSDILTKYGAEIQKVGTPLVKGTTDSLDVHALNEMKETKEVVAKLKALGVPNRKWLSENGFVGAFMILTF
jgi:hypothetical protein